MVDLLGLLDVLIVPLSIALLAFLWPFLSARRRRRNFENLIRRELEEAGPVNLDGVTTWHQHLSRRFLHEELIGRPVDNAEFVLSMDPELIYNLSQLWISFNKAEELYATPALAKPHAEQFCWHLGKVAEYLDQTRGRSHKRRKSDPLAPIFKAWVQQFERDFPG